MKNKTFPYWVWPITLLQSAILSLFHLMGETNYRDVSVYRYVAKVMLEGQVPYRDVFDHKGPIVYYWYAFGHLIHPIYGMFCMEIILLIGIFLYTFKMLTRFTSPSTAIILICSLFSFSAVRTMGNTEWFSLLFITICCDLFCVYIMKKTLFPKDGILLGVSSAALLLIKPVHIIAPLVLGISGLFIGWKRKDIMIFKKIFFPALFSFLITFLVVLSYFIYHNALSDLWNVYVSFNFSYTKDRQSITNIIKAVLYYLSYPVVFLPLGILPLLFHNDAKNKILIPIFLSFIAAFIITVMPGRLYKHYMVCVIPFLLILLTFGIETFNRYGKKIVMFLMICYLFLSILTMGLNWDFDKSFWGGMGRRDFAAIIQKEIPPGKTFLNKAEPFPYLHILSNRNSYSKYPFTIGYLKKWQREEIKKRRKPDFIVEAVEHLKQNDRILKNYNIIYQDKKYVLLKKKHNCKVEKKR